MLDEFEGPQESNANISRIPVKLTPEVRKSRQVVLAAPRPQKTRGVFEKLSSQAAKDGAPESAVPGNSRGAGAPSQGNTGAGKGHRQTNREQWRRGARARASSIFRSFAF